MEYNIGQTPQYGKIRDPELDQGDFVFIGKKPIPPPGPPPDIPPFGPIEGVEIKDNILIAFDPKGNERRKYFDSRITRHTVSDIDQDGKKDVLVGFEDRGKEHSQVIAFDSKMNELNEKWNYINKPDYPYFRDGGFGGKFNVRDLKVFNIEAQKIIVILFEDCLWYPSVLIVLNSNGEKLKEFWHPGHMYQVERIKDVFIIYAVNNYLKQWAAFKKYNRNLSVIFALKYEHIYGEAPPYFGRWQKNTHFEWYYVLAGQEDFVGMTILNGEIFTTTRCGALFFFNENGLNKGAYADEHSCKHAPRLIQLL